MHICTCSFVAYVKFMHFMRMFALFSDLKYFICLLIEELRASLSARFLKVVKLCWSALRKLDLDT